MRTVGHFIHYAYMTEMSMQLELYIRNLAIDYFAHTFRNAEARNKELAT